MQRASQIQKMPELKRRQIKNNKAEIDYLDAITTIGNMVVQARLERDSDKLRLMAKAITQIAFYVNDLQMERENLYLNQL
jgi:hypothetical protein